MFIVPLVWNMYVYNPPLFWQNNLPSATAVERVTEGVETASFKSLFLEWNAAADFSLKFNKNAVKKEDEAIDVQKLIAVRSLEQTAVDDGSGKSDNYISTWKEAAK